MSTFKALLATQQDGKFQASIQPVERDALPPGDVLIRVRYSSLNYKDGLAVSGRTGVIRKFPMIPGIDLAGEVEESGALEFSPGDSVVVTGGGLSETTWGGYAELARVDSRIVVHLPKAFTLRQAMGIGTAGFTAMQCVMALEHQHLAPHRGPIVVTGAGGGVGSVAIAILARRGYYAVASTGRADLGDYLRGLGAAEVVDRATLSAPSTRSLESERWAGGVDSVGGETLAAILRSLRAGGSVAACGLASGAALSMTVFPFILRGVNLLGVNSVNVSHAERAAVWDRLARDLPVAVLDQMIDEVPLESVFEAGEQILKGRIRGRTVIRI